MVSVEEVKRAIVDREEEIKKKFEEEHLIEREIENRINEHLSTDVSVIITGVRRCGKSVLAFMLGKNKRFGYVNFEDERLNISKGELNKVLEAVYSLKGEPELLIFDEIQRIPGWEQFISRLIGGKKVIITGSNARLMSRELATYLTGRHIDFALHPFSFREFLKLKGFSPNIYLTKDITRTKDYLREYMKKGGFPLVYKIGELFLVENYRDIIERDVVQRYNIKYPRLLKDLAKYLITNFSKEISYNKLKNLFRVKSVHTIINYIDYIQNSYLIFLVGKFSHKLKEQITTSKKVYCIDPGIANIIGFRSSENFGQLMENIVVIELKREQGLNPFIEIYYWKDYQQREVDFVVKEGIRVKQLIQVTYASERYEINNREIKSLIKASEELKCDNLLCITWDYEAEEEIRGKKIKFKPLWKWLLNFLTN